MKLDPVVLFFVLGVIARLAKSDLRIPEHFYHTISIYLLLAIGIKGGLELYHTEMAEFIWPALGTIILGPAIALVGFFIARKVFRVDRANAIALAAHYGSCSAVTFAVVSDYLGNQQIAYEEFSTVLLVLMEIPGIMTAVMMAKMSGRAKKKLDLKIFHEVFLGKSILLMTGGLVIGYYIAFSHNQQLDFFFLSLFKGFLALFMVEMGIITADKIEDLKKVGWRLIVYGLIVPIISASMGIAVAYVTGLSMGGAVILATLSASASYIAAPAAMQLVLPQASPTIYLTASLGITFPFNILIGISLYRYMAEWVYSFVI
jgi:hypothetical protein